MIWLRVNEWRFTYPQCPTGGAFNGDACKADERDCHNETASAV
jgi:hypothetical protein